MQMGCVSLSRREPLTHSDLNVQAAGFKQGWRTIVSSDGVLQMQSDETAERT